MHVLVGKARTGDVLECDSPTIRVPNGNPGGILGNKATKVHEAIYTRQVFGDDPDFTAFTVVQLGGLLGRQLHG